MCILLRSEYVDPIYEREDSRSLGCEIAKLADAGEL